MSHSDLVLTIEQAAKKLLVGRTTVWKLIKEQGLPTIKVGRRRLIPVKDLEKWIEENTERKRDNG